MSAELATLIQKLPTGGSRASGIKQRVILSGTVNGLLTITLTLPSATAANVVVLYHAARTALASTDARDHLWTLTSITQNAGNADIVFTRSATGGGIANVSVMVVEYRDIG